jgi:hypothetical protein
VLVGTAFSAMAALLFLHGLATPDVLLEEQPGDQTALLAFAGGATLPVGGAILALAAWPSVLRSDAGGEPTRSSWPASRWWAFRSRLT